MRSNLHVTTVSDYGDELTEENINTARDMLDDICENTENKNYVTTSDNITYYEACSSEEGIFSKLTNPNGGIGGKYACLDKNGFDAVYKVICIDVDGFNGAEAPFGYGIRRDGRILPGKRANEWIDKSIQKGD